MGKLKKMKIRIDKYISPGEATIYPDEVFEGSEDRKEIAHGEYKFELKGRDCKDGYMINHVELAQPPILLLRGIVHSKKGKYVFSAKIDRGTLGQSDYDRLIKEVISVADEME